MTPPDDSLPLPARLMMLAGVAGTTGGALDGERATAYRALLGAPA